jgi:hypothetical protein
MWLAEILVGIEEGGDLVACTDMREEFGEHSAVFEGHRCCLDSTRLIITNIERSVGGFGKGSGHIPS